jgi:hypothetical protein
VDDDCDGLVDGGDADGDLIAAACDNCPLVRNPTQSDDNGDLEGDACDLDDGLIYLLSAPDAQTLAWQSEQGFATWNVYRGDLATLKSTGSYSQLPGAHPLAERFCGLAQASLADSVIPQAGSVAFHLVTGVGASGENSLGTDSAGAERPNAHPCP